MLILAHAGIARSVQALSSLPLYLHRILTNYKKLPFLDPEFRAVPLSTPKCMCAAHKSSIASVTRTKRMVYPRTYPTLLVYPDGSTITVRYKEPRRIIKLPLDFSQLSDAERRKVLANRKPKQKLETIEDFGDTFDVSEYSKYFKH